jgi:Protein of unknown function (DUF1440)
LLAIRPTSSAIFAAHGPSGTGRALHSVACGARGANEHEEARKVGTMKRWSPLGALCAGLAAGLVGALAQDVFFGLTRRWAPTPIPGVFVPKEPERAQETATETVARRLVEDRLERGPVGNGQRAGQLVHYAFGSAWGGAYGLVAGTLPRAQTLRGSLAFGLAVWACSHDVLLPWFRLAAWPHHYPVKTHLYAIAAHAAYGTAVLGTFSGLQRLRTPATVLLGSLWLTRNLPRAVRPWARNVAARGLRVALPVRRVALALA